jgi:hypothetical protein
MEERKDGYQGRKVGRTDIKEGRNEYQGISRKAKEARCDVWHGCGRGGGGRWAGTWQVLWCVVTAVPP